MKKSSLAETKKVKSEKAMEAEKLQEEVVSKQTDKPQFNLSMPAKIAIGAALGVLLLAGFLYNRYWNVATVNGRPISRLEYYQSMEKQAGKQTMEAMITETLILDAARKNNVTVPQADIDTKLSEIENQMKAQGTTLDEALKTEGMAREDLVKQIRVQRLVELMGQGEVTVTDDKINEFLKENKDLLPKDKKPDELKALAKTELEQQVKSENIRNWLADIRQKAQITFF